MTSHSINFGFPEDVISGAYDEALGIDLGYEAGDIVQLITGSPDFVVTTVCDECGDVHVTWYDDHGGLQFAVLPEEAIVYA